MCLTSGRHDVLCRATAPVMLLMEKLNNERTENNLQKVKDAKSRNTVQQFPYVRGASPRWWKDIHYETCKHDLTIQELPPHNPSPFNPRLLCRECPHKLLLCPSSPRSYRNLSRGPSTNSLLISQNTKFINSLLWTLKLTNSHNDKPSRENRKLAPNNKEIIVQVHERKSYNLRFKYFSF